MKNFTICLCSIAIMLAPAAARAEVKVSPKFGDNMVLQRGMSVPVWGTADAGEEVTVKFAGQTKTAKADADGKWRVNLDAMKARAKAQSMTVDETTFKDVLVGDVWVGSGQSNMAGGLAGYAKRDEGLAKLIAAAPFPLIRLHRGDKPEWKKATADNVKSFSALLFAFGAPLQKELDVPVGLIVGAVGGTPSGRWLSPEAFEADAACQAAAKAYSGDKFEAAVKKHAEALAKWKTAAAAAKAAGKRAPRQPRAPQKPKASGDLYIRFIRPIIPYAIRGVLWDQGESGTQIIGVDQFTVMGALIRGWRKEWGQDFPFIYIQKPSGGGCAWDKKDNPVTNQASFFSPKLPASLRPNDGAYRELHIRIMQHANTFMATSSDLGSGVHPTNKSGYGLRACRVALGAAYGKDVEIYGPMYDSHKVEGSTIRITYKHIGKGLAFKGGDKLMGFQIAGADGEFQWADAKIDGKTVVLSCDKVAKPVAARYAWSRARAWANLFNKDGLPAITFQTKK